MSDIEFCANLLVEKYVGVDYENARLFLEKFPNNWLKFNNTLVMFCRLSDESYSLLKKQRLEVANAETVFKLLHEVGRNVHFIGVISDSRVDMRKILKSLYKKSVSWFTPDMKRLVIFERS